MHPTTAFLPCAALACVASSAAGQSAVLVEDINASPGVDQGSDPHGFLTIGTTTFFAAGHVEHGVELWRTDAGGPPELVRDLNPVDGSHPTRLADFGGTLVFSAYTPATGRELWKSDGSEAGTVLVVDLAPGAESSNPNHLVEMGGALYFTADEPSTGRELWRTDGTAAGTVLVADISPGASWSNPQEVTRFGSQLFFRANDGVAGAELWASDGTGPGTYLVIDLFPGPLFGSPSELAVAGGRLHFAADSSAGVEPWISDGTIAGTVLLADLRTGSSDSDPTDFVESAGQVFFAADSPSLGRELWTTDGTEAGTTVVDIVPGALSSGPTHVTALGAGVVFDARQADGDSDELWFSDGTPGGSQQLAVFADEWIEDVAVLGLHAFVATDGDSHTALGLPYEDLHRTDGTPAGTVQLLNDASVGELYADGDLLWFGAGPPAEPWTSDGAATGQHSDVNPGSLSAGSEVDLAPENLDRYPRVLRDRLYFLADDGGSEALWVSDGSEAGTRRVLDPAPWSQVDRFFVTANHLFVNEGGDLWATDGDRQGTFHLTASFPSPLSASSDRLVEYRGYVYFQSASDGELWRTDGTPAGTGLFADLVPGPDPSSPVPLVEFAGRLFLRTNVGLWWTDGTVAGTESFADVFPSIPSFEDEYQAVTANGKLFLYASNAEHGPGLWVTDGTPAGSEFVTDGEVEGLARVDAGVFFRRSADFDSGLWWSDGTPAGTFEVPGDFTGAGLVTAGDAAFFLSPAPGPVNNSLWKSQAPPTGAELVLFLPHTGFTPLELTPIASDARVLFARDDGLSGSELWVSDGTAAGTELVAHATPFGDSSPKLPRRVGDLVVFRAGSDATLHGSELYAVPFLETGGYVAEPFGSGCGGTAGVVPRIYSDVPAVLGATFEVRLADALPSSVAVLFHSFEPVDVALGGCTLLLGFSFDVTGFVATNGLGGSAFAFPIPGDWGLVGVPIYLQYVVADPGGEFEGVASFSEGLEVIAGP